jgi:hypothetical protein
VIPSGAMLPSTCVVVPTYWTRPGGEQKPGDAVYDHPTPIDGQGTLEALLESLSLLSADFYLLILVAVTSDDVGAAAEVRVRDMTARHPDLQALVFGRQQCEALYRWLDHEHLASAKNFLALRRYPCIRNLQLAVPLCLGSKSIVALDDDEIVVDPAFLEKAVTPLSTRENDKRVDGLSGHYLQPNGGILLQVDWAKRSSRNLFDRKAAVMNEATEMLEALPGTLVETPFCFGGNMEFTEDLAASVGFDPGITRGEDIDYLINARMEGRSFFLRKDLTILHCPPAGGSYKDTTTSKLEQDVIRFLYERRKITVSQENKALHPVTADELRPYPGEFLSGDIEADAAEALTSAGFQGIAEDFVSKVNSEMPARVDRYLRFREEWPRAIAAVRESTTLGDVLLTKMNGGS